MWTVLGLVLVLVAAVGFAVFVGRAFRGTPFEGRTFGCGAGYQPLKRERCQSNGSKPS
ncbi:MAG: hypothetical protein IJU37_02535 [Desulfovibrio sp.]|nr:hypothetical protein [Desulfovibrio sp.]